MDKHMLKGRMSHKLTQRINYIKTRISKQKLLKDWSKHTYYKKHETVLTEKAVESNIERIKID